MLSTRWIVIFLNLSAVSAAWSCGCSQCGHTCGTWPRILDGAPTSAKTPIPIIGVQPYSGGAGTLGYKVEPMITIALEQIAADTALLPNHKIVFHFVDSSCSEGAAYDRIFAAHLRGVKKFGVYGAACTGACIASNVVSRNFRTANMAQLCTGSQMSDETLYPEFARFAPDLNKNAKAAMDMSTRFGWKKLAVVMENKGLFTAMGENLANSIRASPDMTLSAYEKYFPKPDHAVNNVALAEIVGRLIDGRMRVVLFVGYEQTLAQLLCESFRRGYIGRKVVFVYATFWIAKTWASDFGANTRCSDAELTEAGKGLFGIDRLRLAADTVGKHTGSGKLPSEAIADYTARCSAGAGCSNMHAAYSYDAVWGWAFTLDRWLKAGNKITDIDYLNSSARTSFYQTELAEQDFVGLTGRVRHYPSGDRDGEIQLFQIQKEEIVLLASIVDQGKTFDWSANILWGDEDSFVFDPKTDLSPDSSVWRPSDEPPQCPQPTYLAFDENSVLPSESCKECPGGRTWFYDESLKYSRCMPCEAGKARAAGEGDVCKMCTLGKFANVTGLDQCMVCPSGHVCKVGAVQPSVCMPGSFATAGMKASLCEPCAKGTFTGLEGASACTSCSRFFSGEITSASSARVKEDCICKENFYMNGTSCETCPPGMDCEEGSDMALFDLSNRDAKYPKAKYGHMTLESAPLESYLCAPKETCPGGAPQTCAGTRIDIVCGRCPDGYTMIGEECEPCTVALAVAAVCYFFFLVLLACFLYKVANPKHVWKLTAKENLGLLVEINIEILQVFAILGGLALEWPESIYVIRSWISIFEFDFANLVPQACLFANASDNVLFFLAAFAFPMIVSFGWMVFLCSKVLPERFRWTVDKTKNMSGKIFNTIFVSQITLSMIPMTCYSHPTSGVKSVAHFPSTLCGSEGHVVMIVIGVASLLLAIFFLSYLLWLLPRIPAIVADPDHDRLVLPVVFLIEDFRVESYWMILPAKTFEFALAMVGVLEPDSTFHQIYLYLGVIAAGALIFARTWCFKLPFINFVYVSLLFFLLLTLSCGLNYIPATEERSDSSSYLTSVIILAFAVFIAEVVIVVFNVCKSGLDGEVMPLLNLRKNSDHDYIVRLWESLRSIDGDALFDALGGWAIYDVTALERAMQGLEPVFKHRLSKDGTTKESWELPNVWI